MLTKITSDPSILLMLAKEPTQGSRNIHYFDADERDTVKMSAEEVFELAKQGQNKARAEMIQSQLHQTNIAKEVVGAGKVDLRTEITRVQAVAAINVIAAYACLICIALITWWLNNEGVKMTFDCGSPEEMRQMLLDNLTYPH